MSLVRGETATQSCYPVRLRLLQSTLVGRLPRLLVLYVRMRVCSHPPGVVLLQMLLVLPAMSCPGLDRTVGFLAELLLTLFEVTQDSEHDAEGTELIDKVKRYAQLQARSISVLENIVNALKV